MKTALVFVATKGLFATAAVTNVTADFVAKVGSSAGAVAAVEVICEIGYVAIAATAAIVFFTPADFASAKRFHKFSPVSVLVVAS